jgi:hypothetical protein
MEEKIDSGASCGVRWLLREGAGKVRRCDYAFRSCETRQRKRRDVLWMLDKLTGLGCLICRVRRELLIDNLIQCCQLPKLFRTMEIYANEAASILAQVLIEVLPGFPKADNPC